jgi:hypothetical protein
MIASLIEEIKSNVARVSKTKLSYRDKYQDAKFPV